MPTAHLTQLSPRAVRNPFGIDMRFFDSTLNTFVSTSYVGPDSSFSSLPPYVSAIASSDRFRVMLLSSCAGKVVMRWLYAVLPCRMGGSTEMTNEMAVWPGRGSKNRREMCEYAIL